MNEKLKTCIAFVSGLVSGAAGMFIFVKTKWQKELDAKRDEMIRYYEEKNPKKVPEKKEEQKPVDKNPELLKGAKDIIRNYNYSKAPDNLERTKNDSPVLIEDEYSDIPYEIEWSEFGSQEMYEMVTLFLYDDGEMRTDSYVLLSDEDVENYIGPDTLEKLAELRDKNPDMTSYFVRNDRLKTDYEILLESGEYGE